MIRRPRSMHTAAQLALLCGALLAGGCRRAAPPTSDTARVEAQRGPLLLSVSAAPAPVWIGEPLTVALRFAAPADYTAELPGADAFKPLTVLSASEPRSRVTNDGVVWERDFAIESLKSGPLELPALTVRYAKREGAPDAPTASRYSELTSDPLKVEVRSALTSQDSMTAPRDITGVLAPPPMSLRQRLLLAASAALAVLALAWLAWWLVKSRRVEATPEPPETRALRALEQLGGAGLVESGDVRGHFDRLSQIVRVYVEEKFALAAPEMTTQEFLGVLARPSLAAPFPPQQLAPMLELCDLVKFAAWAPGVDEGRAGVAAARTFVEVTAEAANARIEAMRRIEGDAGTAARGGGSRAGAVPGAAAATPAEAK